MSDSLALMRCVSESELCDKADYYYILDNGVELASCPRKDFHVPIKHNLTHSIRTCRVKREVFVAGVF